MGSPSNFHLSSSQGVGASYSKAVVKTEIFMKNPCKMDGSVKKLSSTQIGFL